MNPKEKKRFGDEKYPVKKIIGSSSSWGNPWPSLDMKTVNSTPLGSCDRTRHMNYVQKTEGRTVKGPAKTGVGSVQPGHWRKCGGVGGIRE